MSEYFFSNELSNFYSKHGYYTKREVDSGYGIADVVLAKKNINNCELRKSHNQLSTISTEKYFSVLKHLPDIEDNTDPVEFEQIKNSTHISKSYLKYVVLKELRAKNFVKVVGNGYLKINGWVPITNEIVAIESKLRDWRKGIKQACRYKSFANRVFLAIPPQISHLVDLEIIKKNKLGLVVFDPDNGRLNTIREAPTIKPEKEEKRNYVAEHFWNDFLES